MRLRARMLATVFVATAALAVLTPQATAAPAPRGAGTVSVLCAAGCYQ
nr:hypothetical protein [Streptomyces antibioticus]